MERKIGLPGFDRFSNKNGSTEQDSGIRNDMSNDFNDGFNDGFDDDFNDDSGNDMSNDFNDGFNDSFDDDFNDDSGNGMSNDFNYGFNDGFNDGFDDDFNDDSENGMSNDFNDGFNDGFDDDFNDDSGEVMSDSIAAQPEYSDSSQDFKTIGERQSREKVDLKAAFATLFKAISDRFTGKSKPSLETAVDTSDVSFASAFDSAVDEGFALPPEETDNSFTESYDSYSDKQDDSQEQSPSCYDEEFRPPADESGRYSFGDRDSESSIDDDRGTDYYNGRYNDRGNYPDISRNDSGSDDSADREEFSEYDDFSANSLPDNTTTDTEYSSDELSPQDDRTEPKGTAGGVFAAISDALRQFRRRLPSFRPKVYIPPEPKYSPEQDGIGTPTIASDIRRILEEQNKPGETEREYDQMRRYISTVSTDTRIRPGDIKPPENIAEVRAAEDELYQLIHEISSTNEQQRSRIGVYEKPPEEDPYNYRGINDNRQLYSDMDIYSFNMNSRYGFESEQKVDPDRDRAVMEYDRIYNSAVSQQQDDSGMNSGGYSDGFDDGFDDDFSSSPGSTPSGDRHDYDEGFNDDFNEGFNDDFNDGFNDDFNEGFNDDFNEGFNDDFSDDFSSQPLPRQPEKSRVTVRRRGKSEGGASRNPSFVGCQTGRSSVIHPKRRSRRKD